jgi:3',5'-cyclic AMP phosphodiesterase CpdA
LPSFRIAHLSDPHLPAPDGALGLRDAFSKRALSRLAWRRKRRLHDPAVLAALMADVKAHEPDHLAITGDLTNFASVEEFAQAHAWLSALGDSAAVTVSPGNHDALVRRRGETGFETLGAWFGDDAETGFPHVRRRGPVAVVNLCSAVATPPAAATGRLGGEQLSRLDRVLAELAGGGLCRILMLHHPPAPGVVSGRKSLTDAPALRGLLARHGAELVLHGHAHEPAFGAVKGPEGPIPVIGCPSASALPGGKHPAGRWHLFEVDAERPRGGLQVTARAYDKGAIIEVGRYRLPASGGIAT